MTEQQKHLALKAALLLALLEGWVPTSTVTARLGADARGALAWLANNGYATPDDVGQHLRWEPTRSYDELWGHLMPHRPCPVSLCAGPRATQAQQLR